MRPTIVFSCLAAIAHALPLGDVADAIAPGTRIGPYLTAELLGQGAFAQVYRGMLQGNSDNRYPKVAAIKCSAFGGTEEIKALRQARFEQEFKIQGQFNHPNIIKVYGVFDGPKPKQRCAVLEFASGKDLATLCQQQPFSEAKLRSVMRGIVDAVQTIHKADVSHNDIKPENVVMMENGVAKLADFGLARDMKVDPTQRANNNNEGTGRYRAPELSSFSMTQMVDVRNADMYALGKTMWVLLTGYVDAKNKLTWQEWQWSAELAAMIKSTMVEEAKRASATTVLANPWWNQA